MKSFIVQYLFILAVFFNNHTQYAAPLITFYLKPYPNITINKSSYKLSNNLAKPGKIATTRAKHMLPAPISGFFATYGGFLDVSDLDGEISFPRLHTNPILYFLVTEHITPIVISANTLHHWELEEGEAAALYKMEQLWDAQTGVHFWQVTKEPLPKDKIIPLESITLIANPKYIYVPLGIIPFKESPHLILPDIYIKNGINLTQNALYILNLSHYFGSILHLYQKEKMRYRRHLTY